MTELEKNIKYYCNTYIDNRPRKVIIDIGMNRDENGKLCGNFSEDFKAKFGFYTPTPGSTGPMTIAMLMENVIRFYERYM